MPGKDFKYKRKPEGFLNSAVICPDLFFKRSFWLLV